MLDDMKRAEDALLLPWRTAYVLRQAQKRALSRTYTARLAELAKAYGAGPAAIARMFKGEAT
jgi:hypothetical protein